MKRLDFRDPELIKQAATFPFYGQAMALVRVANPFWKLDDNVEHSWKVRFSINLHDCNCEYCAETKVVSVLACTPKDAEDAAFAKLTDRERAAADVEDVRLDEKLGVEFPEWIYEIGGEA